MVAGRVVLGTAGEPRTLDERVTARPADRSRRVHGLAWPYNVPVYRTVALYGSDVLWVLLRLLVFYVLQIPPIMHQMKDEGGSVYTGWSVSTLGDVERYNTTHQVVRMIKKLTKYKQI